jgi:lysozyme family protein
VVHSGPVNAFKTLCATLSVTMRTKVDNDILTAISGFDLFKLNVALIKNRLTFLSNLPKFAQFGKGWVRRVLELL